MIFVTIKDINSINSSYHCVSLGSYFSIDITQCKDSPKSRAAFISNSNDLHPINYYDQSKTSENPLDQRSPDRAIWLRRS